MKMNKYIQSMMAFAAIVSFASCSSEDNNTTIENESATKVMTFTATQEGDEQSTRAAISSTESKVINWQEGDQISIFDGKKNNPFTLKNGKGTPNATFTGEALESGSYTAVYPYQSTASLSGTNVTNVTLPATQTATANSFDKKAALMMAKSDNTTLDFKNAVGYVKVTPKFACSKIVLQAANPTEYLAGKCTLLYDTNSNIPSITFTPEQSTSITLSGNITANTVYYIAVPAVTLSAGWSISFTDYTGDVYTRTGSKSITFKRNTIINLGEFSRTDNNLKLTLTQNGKVSADKQVDMGVFNIGGTNYRLIFAKSNLTKDGLAASESDYGDYFAWGATEPWYTSYSGENFQGWKPEHSSGYASGTAPAFSPEYTSEKDFEMSDDPARKILGCDWQIPTKAIWYAFVNNSSSKSWDSDRKGYTFTNNSQTLFLPAAGYVRAKYFNERGSGARYWSGTAYSIYNAYRLSFSSKKLKVGDIDRPYGCSVRPVRLVAVD
ncbi:hypothetical protein [Prevotella sp. P5-50]|uniref:hypothetical protein n=1 Tax=Prevotella sp. P5-50 TaxID=2024217 RepID=UPI000B979963|nr:hypothetical protein [Prevotella sp. P5-50]OYP42576.1 hypothetical protein CIK88_01290 [Prevotella sp. P5-50]